MDTHLLTVQEAATRAGISDSLVYEWCKKKLLPHFRFGVKWKGGKIMIAPGEFDAFIASCKVGAQAGGEEMEEELTFLR